MPKSEHKLPQVDVVFDSASKDILMRISGLMHDQAQKANRIMAEMFPKNETESLSNNDAMEWGTFSARFKNGREAIAFINAMETKDIGNDKTASFIQFLKQHEDNDKHPNIEELQKQFDAQHIHRPKLVPDIDFEKPNHIRNNIQAAETLRHAATSPVFEVKGKKTGIYVSLKGVPKNFFETIMPILSNIPHLDEKISHNGMITVSFRGADDAKTFHKALNKFTGFSEGEHVINHNIDKAAAEFKKLSGPQK